MEDPATVVSYLFNELLVEDLKLNIDRFASTIEHGEQLVVVHDLLLNHELLLTLFHLGQDLRVPLLLLQIDWTGLGKDEQVIDDSGVLLVEILVQLVRLVEELVLVLETPGQSEALKYPFSRVNVILNLIVALSYVELALERQGIVVPEALMVLRQVLSDLGNDQSFVWIPEQRLELRYLQGYVIEPVYLDQQCLGFAELTFKRVGCLIKKIPSFHKVLSYLFASMLLIHLLYVRDT